jgi:hypothetical protein
MKKTILRIDAWLALDTGMAARGRIRTSSRDTLPPL